MKKNNGITLIALVITIIVLIILAGISINFLFGDNGIISKAQDAGRASNEGKAKEDLAMAWTSATTDYWFNKIDNPNKALSEYLVKEKLDTYLPGSLIGNPVVTDDGYRVKYNSDDGKIYTALIDNSGNIEIISATNPLRGITAEMIAENPSDYYGGSVNYSVNGINGWKIFYADADNIFLIMSDFLEKSKIPVWQTKLVTSQTQGSYQTYWATTPPETQQVTESVKSSFMWTGWNDYSTYGNGKCMSTLLNTDNWRGFVDTKYADYATGGVTIEMFCASWNNLYPEDRLYCNNKNNMGYYLGFTDTPTTDRVRGTQMEGKTGCSNTLYYPHPGPQGYTYDSVPYYRLASPSAENTFKIFVAWNDGGIGPTSYDNKEGAIRPLVRLKANVTLENGTNGYDYNLIIN